VRIMAAVRPKARWVPLPLLMATILSFHAIEPWAVAARAVPGESPTRKGNRRLGRNCCPYVHSSGTKGSKTQFTERRDGRRRVGTSIFLIKLGVSSRRSERYSRWRIHNNRSYRRELRAAQQHGESYWIYLVASCFIDRPRIQRVRNPAARISSGQWAAEALAHSSPLR